MDFDESLNPNVMMSRLCSTILRVKNWMGSVARQQEGRILAQSAVSSFRARA